MWYVVGSVGTFSEDHVDLGKLYAKVLGIPYTFDLLVMYHIIG